MKTEQLIFFLLVQFCFYRASVKAQMRNEGSHIVSSEINLEGYEFRGNNVLINYNIPHSGIVEIRLYNNQGDKIWQNQYSDSWGENTIFLKKSKFHPGETYAFVLNYKRDEVREDLVIPPIGFE